MTGSAVLDLMIAMAFFYFALSLVCSSLNDFVSYAGGWRANNMDAGVRSLLLNAKLPDKDGNLVDGVEALFSHALIQARRRQAKVTVGAVKRPVRVLGGVFRAIVLNPLRAVALMTPVRAVAPDAAAGPEAKPTTRLDFDCVSGADFTNVLFDLLKPKDWPVGAAVTFADVARWVDGLDGRHAELLKSALESLLGVADADIDKLRGSLADWYDSARDQAKRWFGERMRTTSVFVSAAMCFALNIDSIEIANRLKRDADLRAVVVARGQAIPPLGEGQPPAEAHKEAAKQLLDSFQFGWGPNLNELASREVLAAKWEKNAFFGIAVTALAISMGAPFWNRIVGRIQERFLSKPAPPPESPPK